MNPYKGLKLRKLTFDEEIKIKQDEFMSLKPVERLRHSEELAKRIWREKYKYKSLKGTKILKSKPES